MPAKFNGTVVSLEMPDCNDPEVSLDGMDHQISHFVLVLAGAAVSERYKNHWRLKQASWNPCQTKGPFPQGITIWSKKTEPVFKNI